MNEFGKNQMPPEMASELLSKQPVEFGPDLDPQTEEFMDLLTEECAETIQRVTKILRFGFRDNPWTGEHNRTALHREIGDIFAVLEVLDTIGAIDINEVMDFADKKIEAFLVEENPERPRLRHMTEALREKLRNNR